MSMSFSPMGGLNPFGGPPPVYVSDRLRSNGSVNYIQFLRLVSYMWENAHPDVPLVASGGDQESVYPVIVYRGDYAHAFEGEAKPKVRETIPTPNNQPGILIFGQRFTHIITFTVYSELNPNQAEEIREVFENFMIEITPVLKELGVSDFYYARRNPDQQDQRPGGESRTERSVSYQVILEKIVQVEVAKLNHIIIDARAYLKSLQAQEQATPNYAVVPPVILSINDTYSD